MWGGAGKFTVSGAGNEITVFQCPSTLDDCCRESNELK